MFRKIFSFASQYYFFAKMAAMSVSEAKSILGFGPADNPTSEEVNQAYRRLAKEKHPDVGGSHEDMVALNTAKLVLEKAPEPTRDVVWNQPEKKEVIVSFQDAMKEVGVPAAVKWIFASNTGYGRTIDSFSTHAVVFCGKTEEEYIFLGIQHTAGSNPFSNITMDKYTCYKIFSPTSSDLSSVAPRAIRDLFNKFDNLSKGYNAKVVVLPENFELTSATAIYPKGKEMSFKDALVNLGLVGNEHRFSANKKIKVVMYYKESFQDNKKSITLDVNGVDFELGENLVNKIAVDRGGILLRKIFGDYVYGGEKKDLTRMKDGKKVLTWLANNLTTEPEELKELLEKAAENAK